jgi:hypothetical protein
MKIFIRKSSVAESNPEIMASYPADAQVDADTHGPDMVMFEITAPIKLERRPDNSQFDRIEPFARLPDGWREKFSRPILEAEADRRIGDVLPVMEQLTSLRETIDLILQHGTDAAKWPPQAKTRKEDIDKAWNYVREVRERVRALKSLPGDHAHDKNWPARIKRK